MSFKTVHTGEPSHGGFTWSLESGNTSGLESDHTAQPLVR